MNVILYFKRKRVRERERVRGYIRINVKELRDYTD